MIRFAIDEMDLTPLIREVERDVMDDLVKILSMVGIDTISYLRSLTEEMRPPVRAGRAPRPAHPGGWADVTGQLANSYDWLVYRGNGGVALELRNFAAYAATLEAREGYFVLSGVTDPGGPVESAIRRAIAIVAPEWRVL